MDKLKMEARPMDGILKKVAEICPAAVQGDKIDFERLKEELDPALIDKNESYNFTWVGKRDAIMGAASPIRKTLRPCKEESKNWDTTKNLYIEGDNLDALKLLQESYLGKVKMIYIDPPYNTGNDFVYCDDFADNCKEYLEKKGQCDIETNERLFKNDESNGRYHSNWCSMIYPRLKVARDLLSDDGVIFISIDDNEVANLKKICEEVFGESNFVGQFIWRGGRRNLAKYVSTSHEYMLCYGKNLDHISEMGVSWNEKKKGLDNIYKKVSELLSETNNNYVVASEKLKAWYKSLPDDDPSKDSSHYCWIDARGVYFASDISRGGGGGPRWDITNPNTGNVVQTPSRGWSYGQKEDLLRDIEQGLVHFNGDGVPCKKRYLKDNETQVLETVFYRDRRGSSKRFRSLMDGDYFPFPKDEEIISHYMDSFTDTDSIVLDFFSGSATTAHAVMQLNAEDGGNRRFIMVQLPEKTDEKSEAFKAGYKNICEIGKERIRRAGDKIVQETGKSDLDIGFKVLKLDDTNMKDVYYTPAQTTQAGLLDNVDNIKTDRTPLDLLYGVMLDLGLTLDLDIQEVKSGNVIYFNVDKGSLIACFETNIPDSVIKEIANAKPLQVVFRDSCFADAPSKINVTEIFKTISPATKITVL